MGLKMEVEGRDIFLFWHRTMISTVSWHEDKTPSCHETSKHMPHLPKFKVIEELNPNLRLLSKWPFLELRGAITLNFGR